MISVLENLDNLDYNFQLPIGRVNPNKELYQKFLGLMDKKPLSLRDVRQKLNIQPPQAIQLAMVMLSLGWVHLVLPDNDPEPSRRLNQVFVEQSHFSSEYNFLAAPAMGSARRTSMTDFLILAGISNGYSSQQNQELSQFVWQSLASRNLKLKKRGDHTRDPGGEPLPAAGGGCAHLAGEDPADVEGCWGCGGA
ncbi:MAG: hypothetical protein U5L00_04835 [Desulfovermiculus sp.]|nr:hypothetical protein [Desulfovermiculus sp.]